MTRGSLGLFFIIPAASTTATPVEEMIEVIRKTDNEIVTTMEDIKFVEEQIATKEEQIATKEEVISNLEKELEKSNQLKGKRLRALYKESDILAYGVNIFNSMENFLDVIDKIENIGMMIENDKKLINESKVLREKLDSELNEEKKLKEELIDNKEELKIRQAKLEEEKEIAEQKLEELRLEELTRRSYEEKQYVAVNVVSSSDIVNEALKFQGVPYVWGGTTPNGFDCSGLVQYVYAKFGVQLPRVSQDQQNVGVRVTMAELQPGDLVFWGEPAYHVGIYIGSGQYIHAPQPGDYVKISNLTGISSASRISR